MRRAIVLLTMGLAVFLGWKNLSRAAQEVVVLRTVGVDHEDRYAALWVVDDAHHLWIRAEDRRRRWLGPLRTNPEVELRRGGRTLGYRATPFDTPDARSYVDALFRAKYGFADRVRDVLGARDTLPIRLEPR